MSFFVCMLVSGRSSTLKHLHWGFNVKYMYTAFDFVILSTDRAYQVQVQQDKTICCTDCR